MISKKSVGRYGNMLSTKIVMHKRWYDDYNVYEKVESN